MDKRIHHGIKGAVFVYTEIALGRLIAFLVPVLLIRNLTQEEYGIFMLVPSLLLVVAYSTGLGLDDIVMRYTPEYLKKKSPRRVNKLFGITTLIRLFSLALVLAVLFYFRQTITELLNAPPLFEQIFVVIAVIIGLTRFNYLIGDVFTSAYQQRHYVSVIRTITEVTKLLLFGIVVWKGGGIYWILVVMAAARAGELLIYAVLDVQKVVRNIKEYKSDTGAPLEDDTRRLVRFASLSFMSRGAHGFRNLTIDNLLISYFISPVAVAIYGLAAFFPNLVRSFAPSRMLAAVLFPMMVDAYVEDKNTSFLKTIHRFTQKLNMFVLFPMAAGLLVMAEKIIVYVFRPDYIDALNVIYILLVPLLFTTFADIYTHICEVLERKEFVLISSVFSLYNLGMNVLLIPKYGIMGAAVATASASVFLYCYFWLIFRYSLRMHFPFPLGAGGRVLINTAIMMAPVMFMLRFVESALMVFLVAGIGCIIYAISSYFNKTFTSNERRLINEAMGRNWFVF